MCGLFASIGFAPEPARIDIVAHRGPDGRGWRTFDTEAGPVALGHRRLAIIDTSDAGLQPMADASGRYHLIFNGEIYNYLELRDELAGRGEVFTTQSDSEVLLRAFIVWGERCLERLRGMFAFVIWDEREKRLFAARDRFGIKPLYMVEGQGGVAFASEIKQLLGLAGHGKCMNVARVYDFLASGITDHTAETLFDGVRQLRAGEWVALSATSRRLTPLAPQRWYRPPAHVLDVSEAEAAARFRELLDQSVKLHLRSDVVVGSCLSGGLDSSAIVCLMARHLEAQSAQRSVSTVSACYAEKSVDEKPFMDIVVAAADTTPHFVFPRPEDVFARVENITWHQDEPFGSTSIFAQWCVFEAAGKAGIKVMLDGQGADEQLAGYHGSGFPLYMASLARRGRLAMMARTIAERHQYHGTPVAPQIKRAIAAALPAGLARRLRRHRHAIVDHDWLASDQLREAGRNVSAVETASTSLGLPPVTDLASLCMTMTLASNLPMLLHWEDRNSMAHGIEARVPFLDHPLVEHSLALGNSHKIVGGDTKRVLRTAMAGILPEAVRQRRDKLGFATPEEIWFRGPLRGQILDGVETTLALFPGLLNARGTRALAADMLDGRRPLEFSLWRIVNLGIWAKRFGIAA